MSDLLNQYSRQLDDLLTTLGTMKVVGAEIEGISTAMLYSFAVSEIRGLAEGTRTKPECENCYDCCVTPSAIIPVQGIDGKLVKPRQYRFKPAGQPCWWLRKDGETYKCSLHDSGDKPYTCYCYLCGGKDGDSVQ